MRLASCCFRFSPVIILGLSLVGFIAMQNLGGWDQVVAQTEVMLAEAGKDAPSWWSFTGIGWATIIALFISADPVVIAEGGLDILVARQLLHGR